MSSYIGDLFRSQMLVRHCWAEQMASNEGIASRWALCGGNMPHRLGVAQASLERGRATDATAPQDVLPDAARGLGMLRWFSVCCGKVCCLNSVASLLARLC